MGRNLKPGITFYRMDAGHTTNKKIKLLYNDEGPTGYWVWSCLIDYAYEIIGYYFDLNDVEGMELFASDQCKQPIETVMKIINTCIKRGLFKADIATEHKILTSTMMQVNYLSATKDRRDKGSRFTMVEQWLCDPWEHDDPPKNIVIVPVNNLIVPGNNPHSIVLHSSRDNNNNSLEHTAPTPSSGPVISSLNTKTTKKRNAARQNFVPPTVDEAREFFLAATGESKLASKAWPQDKARNEADQWHDHFKEREWKLSNRMQMVDWNASARKWIRNSIKGIYEHKSSAGGSYQAAPAAVASAPKVQLSAIKNEINYLYLHFMDQLPEISIINISKEHYDHCKTAGMCNWDESQVKQIRADAKKFCEDNTIELTEANLNLIMKKYGMIELFKNYYQNKKKIIFT